MLFSSKYLKIDFAIGKIKIYFLKLYLNSLFVSFICKNIPNLILKVISINVCSLKKNFEKFKIRFRYFWIVSLNDEKK